MSSPATGSGIRAASPTPRPKRKTAPAEGERRAIRGYRNQYRVAGLLILQALEGGLDWIRVADPEAERVDDIQLGTPGRVDGFQVKWDRTPKTVSWPWLLNPSKTKPSLARQLADGWKNLAARNPGRRACVHLIANAIPSTQHTKAGSLAGFLNEAWSRRTEGRAAVPKEWLAAWDAFAGATGLASDEFASFADSCELELEYSLVRSPYGEDQAGLPLGVTDIADELFELVSSSEQIVEVSKVELLDKLGWTDLYRVRHHHDFPVDPTVYRAPGAARRDLEQVLDSGISGYFAVVGPPGSGKSSLLTDTLRLRPERVLRYYAFVPGDSSTVLRGEALSFLHDVVFRLRIAGFGSGERLRDEETWLQQELALQLGLLGQAFADRNERTIILVDGLDHATRDPLPARPFLPYLPEPSAVPEGVLIVLGTQTTTLRELSAEIRHEVSDSSRRLTVAGLDAATVEGVIDAWRIEPTLTPHERADVHRLANGHPLSLAYVLRQLADTPPGQRSLRLSSIPAYGGDLPAYYEAHWTSLERDPDVSRALLHAARLRGSINVTWLLRKMNSPGLGTRLADRAGHYFRQPSPTRWTFFHDSFRQFLAARTELDDATTHQQIAAWLADEPGSGERVYHLLKAGEEREALELATFSYFRDQLDQLRPPGALDADARLLASVAAARKDWRALVRLLFIAAEMRSRGFFVDRKDLIDILARLGEVDAVLPFVDQPQERGAVGRPRLAAALALARAGERDSAVRFLDYEAQELLRTGGPFAREAIDDARTWGRASARLLSDDALGDVLDALREAKSDSGDRRIGHFVVGAIDEMVKTNQSDRASTLASKLDLDDDDEREARARAEVRLLENMRLAGLTDAHAERAGQARAALLGRAITHTTAYRLTLEVLTAGEQDAVGAARRMGGPGSMDDRGLEGFRRYEPAMWWTAVRRASGSPVDVDAVQSELGDRADKRVVRVAHSLGSLLGSFLDHPGSVWDFRDAAVVIIRTFVFNGRRNSLDDYALEQSHFAAHDCLFLAATYLGRPYMDALLSLYEEEWTRPRIGWPDGLKERVLLAFLRKGGYDSRVRPLLISVIEKPASGDVSSRFATLLDHASRWLDLGEREEAETTVRHALRGAFGVGYRKDYQLDFWLPWLPRIAVADPAGMPARFARIAGSLKDLDDQTEGRATELAAIALVKAAGAWRPAAATKLLQWLLDAGAVTHHGGVVALLKAAVDVGADPLTVARLAGAWAIPFEREAGESFATRLCKALAARKSTEGARSLLGALQSYGLPSIREGWASVLREELVAAGLLGEPEIASLTTTGYIRTDHPSPQDGLSIEKGPPPDTVDGLLDLLRSTDHMSADRLRRIVPPILAPAASLEILRLEAEPRSPSMALVLAAEELLKRGLVDHAQRLAETALERRSPFGWDRWSDGGTILITLQTLKRLNPVRCRVLAFGALQDDLLVGEADPMSILRDLDELLRYLTDDEPALGVWEPLEAYLDALLDISHKLDRPELAELPAGTFEAALAELAFLWLSHPVTLLSQLTREALELLICAGSGPCVKELEKALLSDDPETALSALAVLEGSAHRSPAIVSRFRRQLEDQLRSPGLDARLAVSRMLKLPRASLVDTAHGKTAPALFRLSIPRVRAWSPRPRLPEIGEPVRDSEDPLEVVGAFADEVEWLARASQLDAPTLAYRMIQIAEELGWKERLGEAGERAVQQRLRGCYLEYPYVRPRSEVVRVALGRAAAELLDHGLIDADTVASLERRFRWTDPGLDALPLEVAPPWLSRPIRGRADASTDEQWVEKVASGPRPLPTSAFGYVIAETSTVRSLDWSRPTERRRRTLVPASEAGAIAVSDDELFGGLVRLTSGYANARPSETAVILRNSHLRFGSTKPAWLTINGTFASACGWLQADDFGIWNGRDGHPRVRSAIWMDGVTDAPSPELYDEPAHGAYVEATTDALAELEATVGQLLAIESVERDARPDRRPIRKSARRFWDWRSLM